MKTAGTSILKNRNIHATGNVRLAVEYFKHIISGADCQSILDIGCGDGVLLNYLNADLVYKGVDIGAGCYNQTTHESLLYIQDRKELEVAILREHVDMVLLINVLEHTEDFSGLFELALQVAKKSVFVCLPNEENIHNIFSFLVGNGIPSHGLDMYGKHLNHRHLWLIQEKIAKKILIDTARKYGFKLSSTHYSISYPNTSYKRMIYKFIMSLLPWRLKSRSFACMFVRV